MAAMESASSCGPQANSHPPPPRAQAPKPKGVILMSEFPNFCVSIRNLFLRRALGKRRSQRIGLFYRFELGRAYREKVRPHAQNTKSGPPAAADGPPFE